MLMIIMPHHVPMAYCMMLFLTRGVALKRDMPRLRTAARGPACSISIKCRKHTAERCINGEARKQGNYRSLKFRNIETREH